MIYVDPLLKWDAHGYAYWCHMGIDTPHDLEPLHILAARIGLRREWFQNKVGHPHYDLAGKGKRDAAIRCGALDVDHRIYLAKCSANFRSAGLSQMELQAIQAYQRQNVVSDGLRQAIQKMVKEGYRLDAFAEAWSKSLEELEKIHASSTSGSGT